MNTAMPAIRLLALLLSLLFPYLCAGQDFLGKTRTDLLTFIRNNAVEGSAVEQGDTLGLIRDEQDDIGRHFDIEYRFTLRNDRCESYIQRIPLHVFWVRHLLDQVQTRNGREKGEPYEIEGEYLFPEYSFDDCTLRTEISGRFLILTHCLTAPSIPKIDITRYGAHPDSRENVIPALRLALEACRKTGAAILSFPRGRYDFLPEQGSVGFEMRQLKELTIEGNGSEFVFHGRMQIAGIDSCERLTMRNFSVDWDRPWISQAEIVGTTDDYLDLRIDSNVYPYTIERDTLKFIGENWKLPVLDGYNILYEPGTGAVVYNTWDSPLGRIFCNRAEELAPGLVRIHAHPALKPAPGTVVALNHVRYDRIGFLIKNCRDIVLEDLKIHHALSHAILARRCENLTFRRTSVCVNEAKRRMFSSVADAMHLTGCRGTILIEGCAHTGHGDDFLNIHGRNIALRRILTPREAELAPEYEYPLAGDTLWLINPRTAQRIGEFVAEQVEEIRRDGRIAAYRIRFDRDLPTETDTTWFVENKTWTPRVEIRNCRVGKRHRARGILVTTPRNVVIEDNYFNTAGTALLIEGDLHLWKESGSVCDMTIRHNVFDNCLTSGNRDGDRWQWGDAVITITPGPRPRQADDAPYHRNIRITDNFFRVFDAPLLRARSVGTLLFTGNRIEKTDDYRPYAWQQSAFSLDGCRDVHLEGNVFDPHYTTRDVLTFHMAPEDLHMDPQQGLQADTTRRYTILGLGDSITEGAADGHFTSYLFPLWEKLFTAGYQFDFIGPRTAKCRIGTLAHSGFSGKNAEFLCDRIDSIYRRYPADIVLLHSGHNHFGTENPIASIITAHREIIHKIHTINPEAVILEAQVIPSGKLPKYNYIPALNRALAKMVHELDDPRIQLVNQAEGFDPIRHTISDKVHPNAAGADLIAQHWFEALQPIMGAAAQPFAPEITTYKQAGRSLTLHIFRPAQKTPKGNHPALILFYAGGWQTGTPQQFYRECAYYASKGMVAIAADYRQGYLDGTSPVESLADAVDAMAWVRRNAQRYGIDPSRIAAGGSSAGGQLAAALGTLPQIAAESRPNLLLLYYAVVDNKEYGPETFRNHYEEFSPLHNISATTPPALFLLGDRDRLIPVQTGRAFRDRMQAAGTECELHIIKGKGHPIFEYRKPLTEIFYDIRTLTDRFLRRHGYLE